MSMLSNSKSKQEPVKYNAVNPLSSKPRPAALSAVKPSLQSFFKPSLFSSPTASSLSRSVTRTPSTATRPTLQRSATVTKTPPMRSNMMVSSVTRTPSVRQPVVTPSTSSKSRTPVQVINQQYRDAKKHLSRTVNCNRAPIHRSIRTLQDPSSSSRPLWGRENSAYSARMQTYPATEGKVRTMAKQKDATLAMDSAKRRSTRGQRPPHFDMDDEMEQGCFLITPKAMRKLFAASTNVETDEEPITMHSVKPSSIFKYLCNAVTEASSAMVSEQVDKPLTEAVIVAPTIQVEPVAGQAEETQYVETLSESIQCDFGDHSAIALAASSEVVTADHSKPDQPEQDAAINLVDQSVQINQSVTRSSPLKESTGSRQTRRTRRKKGVEAGALKQQEPPANTEMVLTRAQRAKLIKNKPC